MRTHITTFRRHEFYLIEGKGLLGKGEPEGHPNNKYHIEHVHNDKVEHEIPISTAPYLPWVPQEVRDLAISLLQKYIEKQL